VKWTWLNLYPQNTLPDHPLPYIPDFAYVYHDLQQTGTEELHQVRTGYLRSMFLLMKLARNKNLLFSEIGRIFGAIAKEDGNFSKTYIVYLMTAVKDKSTFMEALKTIPEPLLTTARNAYEAFILEGMEKGMEKGLEKGKLEGKFEGRLEAILNAHAAGLGIPLIARIVDMPAEEVRRILKEQGKDIEG
jgi:hypothetical protein